MSNVNLSESELEIICEDAFVSLKEVCIRLQERTGCSNAVVQSMLKNVSDYYDSRDNIIK